MKEIAISEFKAKCLALLEQVRQSSGHAVRQARAEILPPSPEAGLERWIGSMKDTMDILGDIVSQVIDEKDIEALRD